MRLKSVISLGVILCIALSCSKEGAPSAMRRGAAPAGRSAGGDGAAYAPVTFLRGGGGSAFVSMPKGFRFDSFRFLTRSTDDTSQWWPQMGTVAAWQTPGDAGSPFLPTDATTAVWPMADAATSRHLSFFAASLDEGSHREFADYFDTVGGGGSDPADPDVVEFLYMGDEDDGLGNMLPTFETYSYYDGLYAYGPGRGWWLSAESDGRAVLTVRNPHHFIDFVAASSPDNGPREAVPMTFTHVMSRVEAVAIDWRAYWNWVQERTVDIGGVYITAIEFGDGTEASFTFSEDGSGTFIPQVADWTASPHWFTAPTCAQYNHLIAYDPDSPLPDDYDDYIVSSFLMGTGSDPYADNPGELGDDVIYLSMQGDIDPDSSTRLSWPLVSPLLGMMVNPMPYDMQCSQAAYEADPHVFGHPLLFPGKHGIRIRFAVADRDGNLVKDTGGTPEPVLGWGDEVIGWRYPFKVYTLEGTFTLAQGTTNNLLVSINPDSNLLDLDVVASMNGWTVSDGGAVTL